MLYYELENVVRRPGIPEVLLRDIARDLGVVVPAGSNLEDVRSLDINNIQANSNVATAPLTLPTLNAINAFTMPMAPRPAPATPTRPNTVWTWVAGLAVALCLIALTVVVTALAIQNAAQAQAAKNEVPSAEISTPAPTEVPQQSVVENPAPAATQPVPTSNVWWSSPDNFDSKETEVPLGDAGLVTYFQAWDGAHVTTTVHVAVAPGLVVRVIGYQGTRHQLTAMDNARFQEMRLEVQKRDKLAFIPPLIVVDSLNKPAGLPASWIIEPFPSPAP